MPHSKPKRKAAQKAKAAKENQTKRIIQVGRIDRRPRLDMDSLAGLVLAARLALVRKGGDA